MSEDRTWVRAVLQRHADDAGQPLIFDDPALFGVGGNEFVATLFSVRARGPSGDLPLVVKILSSESLPKYSSPRHQHRNEAFVYAKILPFLSATAAGDTRRTETFAVSVPKFFHEHEDSHQCLLALEDLAPAGFKLAPKLLDAAHVKLALRELGRFHALSYVAKKRAPGSFADLARRLRPWDEQMCRKFSCLWEGMLAHAADAFRAAYPRDGDAHADLLSRLVAAADRFVEFVVPEEPLAVLCHGDFNRNNLMFRYGEDGTPASVKMIDFQLTTYSSPAIDLSLLLFLSTPPEVLVVHWHEFFGTYRSQLLDTMERSLGCPRGQLDEEFSMKLLMEDFRKFCVHGFIATAAYLPITMLESEDFSKFASNCPLATSPEFLLHTKRFCGEKSKRRLADLVKFLIEQAILQ